MMQSVLFMVINMNVGGTEKALLNMMNTMSKNAFNITVLMLEESGGLLKDIPEHVQIKSLPDYQRLKQMINNDPKKMIMHQLRNKKIGSACMLFIIYVIFKLTNNRLLFYKYILKDTPTFKKKYDIAIAYAGPMDFISYFVVYKLKAKQKWQWIHFDITKVGFNIPFASRVYRQFQQIYVVSEEGKEKLIQAIPSLKEKIATYTNEIPLEEIRSKGQSGASYEDAFNGIRILTVGRLSKEKGQDLVIPVLARLKANRYPVKWYCVGEGYAREEYEKLIETYNVQDDFILLGEKENPYPYMKDCDLYVQPSRHEGYCMTLAEVRCFYKPIISTRFTGVYDHITDEETGDVVEFDENDMYQAVIKRLTKMEKTMTIENTMRDEH